MMKYDAKHIIHIWVILRHWCIIFTHKHHCFNLILVCFGNLLLDHFPLFLSPSHLLLVFTDKFILQYEMKFDHHSNYISLLPHSHLMYSDVIIEKLGWTLTGKLSKSNLIVDLSRVSFSSDKYFARVDFRKSYCNITSRNCLT